MSVITFAKPKRKVSKVFLHCSDSDVASHDNVETIRSWHKERGWDDIGYHYFISKDGTVHLGRNIERIPIAQAGHNTGSIAICLHGRKEFTTDQFISLKKFCRAIADAYGDAITFHGHCEVSSKTCPNFEYKTVLGLDDSGKLPKETGGTVPTGQPPGGFYPYDPSGHPMSGPFKSIYELQNRCRLRVPDWT